MDQNASDDSIKINQNDGDDSIRMDQNANENLACTSNSSSNSRTSPGPGILYIFNHKYFDEFNELNSEKDFELPIRNGTERDVEVLQETFANYDVETIPYNDLTYKQIDEKITEISITNFSHNSCIIIAILTHGFKNNLFAARDKTYNFNDMILKISTNKHLKSKPKIFLLQACRGDIDARNNNKLRNLKTDGPVMSTEDRPYYYCDEKYVLHSATEEFVAYRDDIVGSPFIQIFCLYLNKLGFHRPISEIFPLVMLEVQKLTSCNQMPEITTNAVKPYVFGDYCLGATASFIQSSPVISDGPSRKDITDVLLEESSEVSLQNQNSTPKIHQICASQFTADTRKKRKKGSFLSNISFFKKFVDKELSALDNPETREEAQGESHKWIKFCSKHLPRDAVVAGIDLDGEEMHVGRGFYDNDLLPGKVFLDRSLIAVSYDYREFGLETFEVLTGKCYSWVKPERPGTVPLNAVPGGLTKNGEILYIGRAHHDGSLTPGKIQLSESCLYIPFGGREVKLLNYEVLVKSS